MISFLLQTYRLLIILLDLAIFGRITDLLFGLSWWPSYQWSLKMKQIRKQQNQINHHTFGTMIKWVWNNDISTTKFKEKKNAYLDLGLILVSVTVSVEPMPPLPQLPTPLPLPPVPVSCTCDLSPTAEWLKRPLAIEKLNHNNRCDTHIIHYNHDIIYIYQSLAETRFNYVHNKLL